MEISEDITDHEIHFTWTYSSDLPWLLIPLSPYISKPTATDVWAHCNRRLWTTCTLVHAHKLKQALTVLFVKRPTHVYVVLDKLPHHIWLLYHFTIYYLLRTWRWKKLNQIQVTSGYKVCSFLNCKHVQTCMFRFVIILFL